MAAAVAAPLLHRGRIRRFDSTEARGSAAGPTPSVSIDSDDGDRLLVERVVARELTNPEREELWPHLLEDHPIWGACQSCTEGQIAIVVLERLQHQKTACRVRESETEPSGQELADTGSRSNRHLA
jgi:hypothetical protein